MKLPTEAIYHLTDAINRLHEAARLADKQTGEMIRELADCANAIKEWSNEQT